MTDVIGLLGYLVMGGIFVYFGLNGYYYDYFNNNYYHYLSGPDISAAVLNFYEKLFFFNSKLIIFNNFFKIFSFILFIVHTVSFVAK